MLTPVQQRAVGLFSMGADASQIANSCEISSATLYRWKKLPEFDAAIKHHLKQMQLATDTQIQTLASESVDGMIDAQRELRRMILDPHTPPHVKQAACATIMRYGCRWLDLQGYNAKFKEPKELFVSEPDDPQAPEIPDRIPPVEAGKGEPREASEMDPPPAIFGPLSSHDYDSLARGERPSRLDENGEKLDDSQTRYSVVTGPHKEDEDAPRNANLPIGEKSASAATNSIRREEKKNAVPYKT